MLKTLVLWGKETQKQAVTRQFQKNYSKGLIAQASGDSGRWHHLQKSRRKRKICHIRDGKWQIVQHGKRWFLVVLVLALYGSIIFPQKHVAMHFHKQNPLICPCTQHLDQDTESVLAPQKVP